MVKEAGEWTFANEKQVGNSKITTDLFIFSIDFQMQKKLIFSRIMGPFKPLQSSKISQYSAAYK